MEGGPLLENWWQEDSKNFVLYLNITTRVDTHPDQGMLQKKGGAGFPHFVLMDSEGEVLTQFRPSTQEALKSAADKAHSFVSLRSAATARPDDADANAQFIIASLGMKDDAALREKLEKVVKGKISADTRKAYESFAASEQLKNYYADFRKDVLAVPKEERDAVVEQWHGKSYAKWKAGMKPVGHDTSYTQLMVFAAHGAMKSNEKADAEILIAWVEATAEKNPQYKQLAVDLRADLTKTPEERKAAAEAQKKARAAKTAGGGEKK